MSRKKICRHPSIQRRRWTRYPWKLSAESPAARSSSTNAERHPFAWSFWLVWMSSVIERRLNPPTERSASRRNTAPLPTKNAPPQRVAAALDCVVEEVGLVRHRLAPAEGALEDVGVVEVVRRLDDAHPRVAEVRHGPLEEARLRDVVGVEDHDELAGRDLERRVEVARLGVAPRAGQVARAVLGGEPRDLLAVRVVAHVDCLARPPERGAGGERPVEEFERLGVDSDEDVHRRGGLVGPERLRRGAAPPRDPDLHGEQRDGRERVAAPPRARTG